MGYAELVGLGEAGLEGEGEGQSRQGHMPLSKLGSAAESFAKISEDLKEEFGFEDREFGKPTILC